MRKTKLIALVNLIAFAASSFSPLYADTREDKLKQREAAVAERAATLSDKEISLEDKEHELSRRSAELEEMSKAIRAQSIETAVREIELEDMRAKFNKDSELLAARNVELARDREQVDTLRADIERRASEAEKLAREADEKFRQAEERGLQAEERERELSAREETIAETLRQLNLERAELLMAKQNAEEIQAKLSELDQQEKNLKAAQKIFADEKDKLAQEKAALEAAKAEAERSVSEARALIAAAEEKARQADAVIAQNEEQKNRIAELERELAEKNEKIRALLPQDTGDLVAEEPIMTDIPSNSTITTTGTGLMNWSDGSIRARGLGVPPEGKTGEQAKALARRAAIVDLQRNLLETIQGVQIDSKTTVKDFMATDTINSAVAGTIKGVEVIDEKWDGKSYVVFGQVRQEKMAGALSEVAKKIKMVKLPKEPKKNGGNFTGLIIDARHLTLSQQKYFHVVDETGKIVYGIEFADKNKHSQIGLCAYFDRIVYEDNEERVGDTPLVVKAQRLTNDNTDIVIPNYAADQIRRNRVNFRKDCKVIVVKS